MRLPWPVVAAHLRMIPVLSAEKSLRRVTEIAAGSGLIKENERNKILNSWRRDMKRNKNNNKITLDNLIVPGLPIVEV